jgi:hypothetical protein
MKALPVNQLRRATHLARPHQCGCCTEDALMRPARHSSPKQFQSIWVYIGICHTNSGIPERPCILKETCILPGVHPTVSGATSTWRSLKALKTYSLSHDQGEALNGLMAAHNTILNTTLQFIWRTIEWKKHQVKGKKQYRLYPKYRKDNAFKRELRNRCLKEWCYAAH